MAKNLPIPLIPSDNSVVHDIEGTTIYAAGALCWRVKNSELEVLIIHRPKYDDWSWPKGKMDPGETIPETAVREVKEEVGLTIRLGRRLPTLNYNTKAGPKEVHYWASHVPQKSQKTKVDGKEVDKAKWKKVSLARQILTKKSDRKPLDALVKLFQEGTLDTYPFIVVRHAKAKPRSLWTKPEGDRPLASTGKRQAKATSQLLKCWNPTFIASSPWKRCKETVRPFTKDQKPKYKTYDTITESANKRNPKAAKKTVDKVFSKQEPTALCVHRPTIPNILSVLSKKLEEKTDDKDLPQSDPYLEPGEMLVFQISEGDSDIGRKHKILSVEQYKPFSD